MSRKVTISYVWKDLPIIIEAEMLPAEWDVGIMNPYPNGLRVLDLDGKELNLSDGEYEMIFYDDDVSDRLVEAYYE